MTIDEAIKHAEEEADLCEDSVSRYDMNDPFESYMACKDRECAEDHRQLVGWLKELKQLREQTRWIPVSERLPEEDGQYIITVKYKHEEGYEDIYVEHGEWDNGKWDMFGFGHCGEVEKILAWMPLPEPYKAESEESE